MPLRFTAAVLVAAAGLALIARTAAAQAPVETAIQGWVTSIDASADWNASYKSLTYDAASDRAVLDGLTIGTSAPGVQVSFGVVAITGYSAAADGGFTARQLTADEGTLEVGPFKIALSDAEINAFTMPALPALIWDPQHLFTSLIHAYAPLSRLAMTNGRVGSFGLIENNAGVSSRVVYDQFRIDRWADGKIAAVTAGPLSMESPDPDGLVTAKVASLEARDIDIDAALRVFDPERYAGGVGDGVWHTISGLTAYHDFAVSGPGVKMTMALLSLEGFKLRQPPRSFAAFLDQVLANPNAPTDNPEAAQAIVDMASAYRLDRFGISGLDITATGMKRFHLGGFDIADLSIERLGELAVDDFATEVEDAGQFKLGHFAVGDVAFPSRDELVKAILASEQDSNANTSGLAPRPGFFAMSGLDIAGPGIPSIALDKLRVDLANYIGAVPTSVSADIDGLVMPVSSLDASARAVFAKLGYDTLDLAYHLKANWNEADETLNVGDLRLDMKGAGGLALKMLLTGLPREALEKPESLPDVLPNLSLKQASLTLKDDSIVGKGLDLLADKMHAKPETFRQKFADAMPLLLSLFVLNDPKIASVVRQSGILAKLAPVVKAFVAAPGSSITLSLAPPSPVAFPAISAATDNEPASLITLLGLSAESSAPAGDTNTGAKPQGTPDQTPQPPGGDLRPTTPAQ